MDSAAPPPLALDDPTVHGHRHRVVLAMAGLRSSVISFVRGKQLKRELNEQFRLSHDWLHPSMSLSKLRRCKLLLLAAGRDADLELSTVALAHAYLERLCWRNVVEKKNRKLLSAVCLTLAYKYNEGAMLAQRKAQLHTLFTVRQTPDTRSTPSSPLAPVPPLVCVFSSSRASLTLLACAARLRRSVPAAVCSCGVVRGAVWWCQSMERLLEVKRHEVLKHELCPQTPQPLTAAASASSRASSAAHPLLLCLTLRTYVCVCACVRVRACACACVRWLGGAGPGSVCVACWSAAASAAAAGKERQRAGRAVPADAVEHRGVT